ncbi:MAG: glycosyltransferase family 4 protein [Actinomycetota bacterium]|nr:glycosyltransferase family 4 protein [Actinomycetota bacterium]
MNIVVITPHFAPDIAPTGQVVTRVVEELGGRGHRLDVVTALPWYRSHSVEPGFAGRLYRYEDAPWGRITRVHPFPASDKRNLLKRAGGYAGFSALVAVMAGRGKPADAVLALSPPLTLGVSGWAVARRRRAPFVFNVQDVYPDVAIELGVIKRRRLVQAAHRLERWCYERADAVTVLAEDLKENVGAKASDLAKIRVIPNFVDTDWIRPLEKENSYRREFGLEGKFVVMYAGNIGLSQGLEIVIEAAGALTYEADLVFVLNGGGASRERLEHKAAGLPNVRFINVQPEQRLPEVLAAADLHLVTLRRGLARTSVPSKTYSVLAAGRPLVASVDEGSEVAGLVERSGAGVATPPEDAEALAKTVRRLMDAPGDLAAMGASGRRFVEGWASPAAVASAYESLFEELRRTH